MINPRELRERIIRPVCIALDMGGAGVEELLLGTAMQESNCGAHIVQVGGPALGVWQMEPATHDDLWQNFLSFRKPLGEKVATFCFGGLPRAVQMIGNMYYACAMARIQYYRSPLSIPVPGDIAGQAALYKTVYNTPLGAATPEQYIASARKVLIA